MAATAVRTAHAVRWFHALSDETRLDIIARLLGGERCVCELTGDLAAQQPRLSFHLKTLKEAGLGTDRREGRWVYYTLNRETLREIEALVGQLVITEHCPPRAGRCC